MVSSRGYELLENKLGYTFKDPSLLETALTHKSFVNENAQLGRTHNQRLEFLGDAVLGLIIGHILMVHLPYLQEGELSMTRAEVVSEQGVSDVAAEVGLGEWLFLGRGEENTGGRKKPSLLADALEAVIAAVYLDGGFEAAGTTVQKLFVPRVSAVRPPPGFTDFKTRLQEKVQALHRDTPKYKVIGEVGPDHDKYFEVMVTISGKTYAKEGGRSKKEAEQRAAEMALFALETEATAQT